MRSEREKGFVRRGGGLTAAKWSFRDKRIEGENLSIEKATQVTKLITCSDEIWLSFQNEICDGFSPLHLAMGRIILF